MLAIPRAAVPDPKQPLTAWKKSLTGSDGLRTSIPKTPCGFSGSTNAATPFFPIDSRREKLRLATELDHAAQSEDIRQAEITDIGLDETSRDRDLNCKFVGN